MSTEQQDRGRDAQGKHTPGPWAVRTNPGPGKVYEGGDAPATVAAGDRLIATVGHQGREWEANARLIASAPAMARALRAALLVIDRQDAALTAAGKGINLSSVPGFEGADFIVTLDAILFTAEGGAA